MKRILILFIFGISVLGNVYFTYFYYKELKHISTLRKKLEFAPYMLLLEQINNVQLYYQKPEILEAKIYSEVTFFFKNIEKFNKKSYVETGCINWSDKSKNIFNHFVKEGISLYKIDDNEYNEILQGINFMDKLCKKRKIQ